MKQVTRTHHRMAAVLAGLLIGPGGGMAGSIVRSPHDLSAGGPGLMRAAQARGICILCHTPHRATADAPGWNRFSSGTYYIPYSSSTAKAPVGQPSGASKLCLSCHDGTMALGMIRSRRGGIKFAGGVVKLPKKHRANLGYDLSDDHPISFTYDAALASANGELKDPEELHSSVRLDADEQLQCTSCHNAHDNEFGKFLVMDNYASALCVSCHEKKEWPTSSHGTSLATWNKVRPDPWPHTEEDNVHANGCENCHRPHAAGTKQRLLNFSGEEENCRPCHNGHVADSDVMNDFKKFSVHPVTATMGIHDPTEDTVNAPRHVECDDCHNPHAARSMRATPPAVPGAMAGVKGVGASGNRMATAQREYEVCYKCHADSTNRGAARVNRVAAQTNVRLEFATGNASYHPVHAEGRNADVPSLLSPYTRSSKIYCGDCHNSDSGSRAGGAGPDGPHGSLHVPILERQLVLKDYRDESSGVYALCYKCHSRNSILSDESFDLHRLHVVEEQTACTTCHDSHGVAGNTHLINFNTEYVRPNAKGRLAFDDGGSQQGSCSLTCHGADHDAAAYPGSELSPGP